MHPSVHVFTALIRFGLRITWDTSSSKMDLGKISEQKFLNQATQYTYSSTKFILECSHQSSLYINRINEDTIPKCSVFYNDKLLTEFDTSEFF